MKVDRKVFGETLLICFVLVWSVKKGISVIRRTDVNMNVIRFSGCFSKPFSFLPYFASKTQNKSASRKKH